MAFITPEDWEWYQVQMLDMNDGAAQMEITWKHVVSGLDRFGEGNKQVFDERTMKVLINYNYVRVWPIDSKGVTGDEDKQYMNLFLFKPYLDSMGWTTPVGNFDYNPGLDEFIAEGLVYKPDGDTPIAPDATQPLFFSLILQRLPIDTANSTRP